MTLEAWAEPELVDTGYRGIVSNEPKVPSPASRPGFMLWVQSRDGLGSERFLPRA